MGSDGGGSSGGVGGATSGGSDGGSGGGEPSGTNGDDGGGTDPDSGDAEGTPDTLVVRDVEGQDATATAVAASAMPTRTPTPRPTATPTATPIPTALTVTIGDGCSFASPRVLVARGGTVTFYNGGSHEVGITIFPPDEDSETVGQGLEPGLYSQPFTVDARGVSKVTCEGPDDGQFGNMSIAAFS